MNVVFGDEQRAKLGDKYIALKLDKVGVRGEIEPTQLYAVIGADSVSLGEMPVLDKTIELHQKFIDNYLKQDWNYCEQALTHLKGKFGGDLDSFYNIMSDRIRQYRLQGTPPNWDGVHWSEVGL